jgi:DNA mismatch repair protein MutL
LRAKFLSTDLTARAQFPAEEGPAAAHDEAEQGRLRQELVDWAKGKVAAWEAGPELPPGESPAPPWVGASGGGVSPPERPLELTRLDRPWAPAGTRRPGPASEHAPHVSAGPEDQSEAVSGPNRSAKALQIHNRYLIAETDDGLMVIDQHALHERILYEHLRERVAAGPVQSQNLLVPEPVDLAPAEAAAALEHRDVLARLGVRIEPFGGETILIQGYPAMLANLEPQDVLRGLLEPLLSAGKQPDERDLLDELLHTVACKAAIKAGDRLSAEEIAALLEQRHLIDDPHHCPHGRPAALVFTREELDKQFKRV